MAGGVDPEDGEEENHLNQQQERMLTHPASLPGCSFTCSWRLWKAELVPVSGVRTVGTVGTVGTLGTVVLSLAAGAPACSQLQPPLATSAAAPAADESWILMNAVPLFPEQPEHRRGTFPHASADLRLTFLPSSVRAEGQQAKIKAEFVLFAR